MLLPNPAVIIGLGGTGKWVLTYVKKNLLDTYGGTMPPTVRLLSFDTTEERSTREGVAQEEEVRVGNVQLDNAAEFVYLGGNIKQICCDIRDKGRYPHIGSWLQAKTYLQQLDPDAFEIARGAGQKRPFGRMAVFYDLQKQVAAQLTNKIEMAISDVNSGAVIEIYVVASLAGGTGAGMFIDVAHLVRWMANQKISAAAGFALRGFLALHNTFRKVIRTEQIQANAFAAMRELDRFMLVFNQQYPIVYDPTYPRLNTVYNQKLFDNCYLLDASREKNPLDDLPPKYGVYPAIADAITMLLDPSTGNAYQQHYVNVNTRIANTQQRINKPIYSSLGTYQLILPVEDIIKSLTYRFVSELLSRDLLNLERQPNEAGEKQDVLGYEEEPLKEARKFLQRTKSASGLLSTNFIQRVPNTVEDRNTQDEGYIAETADLYAAELVTWILPPENDKTVQKLAREIREVLDIRLINRVQPSNIEGDDYMAGCDRVERGVQRFKEDYLGRAVHGRRVGGRYRKALDKCVKLHRERYQKLLEEYLLDLLNGPAAKKGKLGLAQALLDHLADYFHQQAEFLEGVKTRRASTNEHRTAQEEANLCRTEMQEAKTKGSIMGTFFKGHHPAVKTQQEYIEAEQDLIDYEVNEMLFDALEQTSKVLRSVTQEYKAAVESWIKTLFLGVTEESLIDPGLYRALQKEMAEHKKHREEKKRLKVHQYETDEAYEKRLYQTYTQGKFGQALTTFVWEFEPSSSVNLTLSGFALADSAPFEGQTGTERNIKQLIKLAEPYFYTVRQKLNIADRLAERNPLELANDLLEKCSPMTRYEPAMTGGAQELHHFVCVNQGRQQEFFNKFGKALTRLGTAAAENQVLNSANRYTCTILSTADVIASQGFKPYQSAEREYNQHLGDARLLHVFPAEVNAVHLEQQLPRIGEVRRRFSPLLTTMLEDRQIVELFIRAYLYHAIYLEPAENNTNRWVLYLPNPRRRRYVESFPLTPAERRPRLFSAMECFVFRQHAIDNEARQIDMQQLQGEIEAFEKRVSGGDHSRLINLLEELIDKDIQALRGDSDQAQHDLASLMRLVIDEIIESLEDRLKASGKDHDRKAEPLVKSMRPPAPEPTIKPLEPNLDSDSSASVKASPTEKPPSPIAPSPPPVQQPPKLEEEDEDIKNLQKLKNMLALGLASQEQYDAKVQEILDRM